MNEVTRGVRLAAAGAAVGAVALLTLGPGSLVAPARGALLELSSGGSLLEMFPSLGVNQVLNAVLFIPLGATMALLLPRRLWPVAIVAGFALSLAVEYAQSSIPGRVPDLDDVLWNSVGGAVGVALVGVPRLVLAWTRSLRQRGSATAT